MEEGPHMIRLGTALYIGWHGEDGKPTDLLVASSRQYDCKLQDHPPLLKVNSTLESLCN